MATIKITIPSDMISSLKSNFDSDPRNSVEADTAKSYSSDYIHCSCSSKEPFPTDRTLGCTSYQQSMAWK